MRNFRKQWSRSMATTLFMLNLVGKLIVCPHHTPSCIQNSMEFYTWGSFLPSISSDPHPIQATSMETTILCRTPIFATKRQSTINKENLSKLNIWILYLKLLMWWVHELDLALSEVSQMHTISHPREIITIYSVDLGCYILWVGMQCISTV